MAKQQIMLQIFEIFLEIIISLRRVHSLLPVFTSPTFPIHMFVFFRQVESKISTSELFCRFIFFLSTIMSWSPVIDNLYQDYMRLNFHRSAAWRVNFSLLLLLAGCLVGRDGAMRQRTNDDGALCCCFYWKIFKQQMDDDGRNQLKSITQ